MHGYISRLDTSGIHVEKRRGTLESLAGFYIPSSFAAPDKSRKGSLIPAEFSVVFHKFIYTSTT
jgi:hypothetical protein